MPVSKRPRKRKSSPHSKVSGAHVSSTTPWSVDKVSNYMESVGFMRGKPSLLASWHSDSVRLKDVRFPLPDGYNAHICLCGCRSRLLVEDESEMIVGSFCENCDRPHLYGGNRETLYRFSEAVSTSMQNDDFLRSFCTAAGESLSISHSTCRKR